MMMQMMMAGSGTGMNPQEMMMKMMKGGPMDTNNSGLNLASTRNGDFIQFE
jgi:hypothetical protein